MEQHRRTLIVVGTELRHLERGLHQRQQAGEDRAAEHGGGAGDQLGGQGLGGFVHEFFLCGKSGHHVTKYSKVICVWPGVGVTKKKNVLSYNSNTRP